MISSVQLFTSMITLRILFDLLAWTNWLRQYHINQTMTSNYTSQSLKFVIFKWFCRLQISFARRSIVKKVVLAWLRMRDNQMRFQSTQSLTACKASSMTYPHRMQALSFYHMSSRELCISFQSVMLQQPKKATCLNACFAGLGKNGVSSGYACCDKAREGD